MTATPKICPRCGTGFGCDNTGSGCWCAELPPIMPLADDAECLCPACLKNAVSQQTEHYVSEFRAGRISRLPLSGPAIAAPPIPDIDYYIDNGRYVFTAWYLLRRGYCCGNGCRHCPYPKSQ